MTMKTNKTTAATVKSLVKSIVNVTEVENQGDNRTFKIYTNDVKLSHYKALKQIFTSVQQRPCGWMVGI